MILKEAPAGAEVIDLVAARAARAEVRKDAPARLVKVTAGFVELAPEIDIFCAADLMEGRYKEGLSKLLADPADIEPLLAFGLSVDDLSILTEAITGRSLGE